MEVASACKLNGAERLNQICWGKTGRGGGEVGGNGGKEGAICCWSCGAAPLVLMLSGRMLSMSS